MNPKPDAFRSYFRHTALLRLAIGALAFAANLVESQAQQGNTSEGTQAQAPAANPTNMARGFSGAGAYIWDEKTSSFVALPALAAVIDDDVTSGWTPPSGKTRMLIQLQQDADISSFTLFAPGAEGTYSLQLADSLESLSAGKTKSIAAGVDLGSLNKTGITTSTAKYLVVEMDVVKSAPIRGVQVLGVPKAGSAASIAVVSPKADGDDKGNKDSGEVVEVNFALRDAGGATPLNPDDANKLIDGDTATTSTLPAGKKDAVIRLASSVEIDRVALAVGKAEGKVSIFVTDGKGNDVRELGSVTLDGKAEAISVPTSGIRAEFVRIEWTPANGSGDLVVKEVGIFAQARVTRSEPPPNTSVATLPLQISLPVTPPPPAPTPPPEPVAIVRATST